MSEIPPSLELRLEVYDLYDAYVACLDDGDLEGWPELFSEECLYEIIPRENWDRGLPLALVRCESKGMLKDRLVAVRETMMYAPRYLRHIVSSVRIREIEDAGIRTAANYCVLETLLEEQTKILQTGRYLDLLVREGGRLKFKERHCVYDSIVVPNSIIYPI